MGVTAPIEIVPPAEEPVSYQTAAYHLRLNDYDNNSNDGFFQNEYVSSLIRAARYQAESFTNRCFVSRTIQVTFDRFPPYDYNGWDWWNAPGYPSPGVILPNPITRALRLWGGKVSSIVSFSYVDSLGNTETLTEGVNYRTHLTHTPPLIYPQPGTIWPITQFGALGNVTLQFVAGYGPAASNVPPDLVMAILMQIAYLHENRGDAKDPSSGGGMSAGAMRILNDYRLVEYR
ncbi:hypothetical protein [Fimbriiglobus ruber]|uniref:Phage protein n=1 Tax=Fimbriiglobus ruber TaxID=1908690 RepID=A0A225DF01_9BACT|nr:hypothetical protein [Fimbriiglobus ruber]OWK34965.1 hypothetical protein FRUB_09807 [Fimbriiglobus ruber]